MEEYCNFLSTYAGLSEKTIKSKYKNIVLFFEHTEISTWDNLSAKISAANIDSFMKKRCEALSISLRKEVASCLRSAFRYWHLAGIISEDLAFLVPSIRSYALSSVPSFISWEEVQQLLQAFDRNTKLGKRNYLIILLLATYGWRAGELVNLTLDDINWRNNCIRIYHTKTKVTSTYPLLSDIGTAIIDYLQNSRPPTKYRNLIIRAIPPTVPFASATGISDVVRRAFCLAEIKPLFSRCGAHTLRHSRAVNMIDHGIPFKTVGDMLGHRSPNSTMIYTKVDLKRLRCATLETIGKYNEK
jgi:site-specific recombinase XerD